jgi:hypothetical protein
MQMLVIDVVRNDDYAHTLATAYNGPWSNMAEFLDEPIIQEKLVRKEFHQHDQTNILKADIQAT